MKKRRIDNITKMYKKCHEFVQSDALKTQLTILSTMGTLWTLQEASSNHGLGTEYFISLVMMTSKYRFWVKFHKDVEQIILPLTESVLERVS